MTESDLQQLRREKWRLDGKPLRTIEEARTFVETIGFCLMYPVRPSVPVPTFIGAVVGSDDRLPTWRQAYSDPRATAATEMMVRLLRERSVYEANLFEENNPFLVTASAFPFFYALVGDRNPKQPPKRGPQTGYSDLACDAFDLIRRDGPIAKQKLQEALGGSVSIPALDKALEVLLTRLRITRVDYNDKDGSFWDLLYRWSPDAVKEGVGISVQQALTAVLSKYLDCVVAAEPAELETFFGKFVARSRVKDAVNAMLAAREFSFVHVSGRSMLQITPEKEIPAPRPAPEERNKTRGPFKKTFTPTRSTSERPSFGSRPPGRTWSDKKRSDKNWPDKKWPGKSQSGRPTSERPSLGRSQPGRSQPGRSQPEGSQSDQPQFGRPPSGQSESGKPWFPRPRSGRPPSDRRPFNRPPSGQPSNRPTTGRPSSARPSSGRPSPGRPSSNRPSYGRRPPSGRPSSGGPASDRPSPTRPSSNRPSSNRPSTGRPSSGRPQSNRPSSERRPPSGRPSRGRPASGRPSPRGSSSGRPPSGRPSSGRPNRPPTQRPPDDRPPPNPPSS